MTWINPEAWMKNLDNKPININLDTKLKTYDEYLKDNFFYPPITFNLNWRC